MELILSLIAIVACLFQMANMATGGRPSRWTVIWLCVSCLLSQVYFLLHAAW